MKQRANGVNIYLLLYLILYLSISVAGDFFLPSAAIHYVEQFLPLVLGILYLKFTRQPILSTIKVKKVHPATIPLTILFTFCIWPLLSAVNSISLLFSPNLISETVTDSVLQKGVIITLITSALFPAIVEEFTFRGVLYSQYRNERPIKAALLSGLCFGLMHMNFNQFSYAFVLGMILALLIEASGSIIPSMLVHFTFNAVSIVAVFVSESASISSGMIASTTSKTGKITIPIDYSTVLFTALFVLITFLIACRIYRRIAKLNHNWDRISNSRHEMPYTLRPNPKLTDAYFYAFVIICFVMCLLMQFVN